MLVFLMTLSAILCQAQAMIGIDLTGLLHSELKVVFGHEVAEHWSLSAAAGVNFRALRRKVGTEENKHQMEYPTGPELTDVNYAHRERICWKGLTGNIRYDLGIIRSNREGKLSVQDLSIGIYWIF